MLIIVEENKEFLLFFLFLFIFFFQLKKQE